MKREKSSLSRLSQIVATETQAMFNRIRLLFDAADLWFDENPGADPRREPGFARLIEAFGGTGEHRRTEGRIDVYLISKQGGLFLVPSSSGEPYVDVRDRAYFKVQTAPATRGFYIGEPILSRVTGQWALPVSYPIPSGNAHIALIAASIELPDLEKLYDSIRPKPNGSIALFRSRDGILLARSPFIEGAVGKALPGISLESWRDSMAAEASGSGIAISPLEGKGRRIFAYSSIPSLDLVLSITSSVDDVLAPWKRGTIWRLAIASTMIAALCIASFRLFVALGKLGAAQFELRENLERLRRSDATKDKLFSVIAHDLRGPIGGMCNLLETMTSDRGDMPAETLDEFIGALRLTSWNTYQLLENLLAWSRNKRGEMPFHPERVLLQPMIEESAQVFALSVADKRLSLETQIEPGLEARADPELFKVVLRNLISNAVKFTRQGGKILVSASREAQGARVTVRDEGIGMDQEQLGALFDLEATRSRSGTANEHGSGLGLVLSKEILDLHGGIIEVDSEAGAGSSFSVFLPDEGPAAPAPV